MNPERWRQIEELYHAALARAESERAAFLVDACRSDQALRREVESLLAQPVSGRAFLDRAALARASDVHDERSLVLTGQRIGVYELQELIGAGGMSVVYRALDTKLNRPVAIKFLSDDVANAAARRRFQREAQTASSLNHPHILTVHDAGEFEGRQYLVTEFIDGGTLRDWAHGDGRGWRESIELLVGVADGLATAHEAGILHRDVKPENILITRSGYAKLADFGLAKLYEGVPVDAVSRAATETRTSPGVIVGTIAYMSPEQASAQPVDVRSDMFSFGVVLYEVLAGQRPFTGSSDLDVLQAIVHRAPRPLPEDVPLALRMVVEKALEKDPADRFQSMRDMVVDLRRVLRRSAGAPAAGIVDGPAAHRLPAANAGVRRWSQRTTKVAWLVAGVLLVVGGVSVFLDVREPTPQSPLMQFSVDLGPDAIAGQRSRVAISRDGRRIVFPTKSGLATRTLDQANSTALAGTEGAEDPFFSPDGRWIGFFADGKLKKVAVQGGAPVIICDAPRARGAHWGDDDDIILQPASSTDSPLVRVSSTGGTAVPITKFEPGDVTHRWPYVLPGATAVLFTSAIRPGDYYDAANIDVVSVGSGQRKTLVRGGFYPRYVATVDGGYLLYVREGTLFAAPFDLERLELTGTPGPVLEDVGGDGLAGAKFDVSQTGALVYQSGKRPVRSMAWLDSAGQITPLRSVSAVANPNHPRFSPDGKRLAFHLLGKMARDIWVYDVERENLTQLTFTERGTTWIAWTPDGKHLVYGSASAPHGLWWVRADGAGEPQLLLESSNTLWPASLAPDGTRLAYVEASSDIWTIPLDLSDPEHPRAGKPEPFQMTAAVEQDPAFSPDGRWIAYVSNESGRAEVFVRPLAGLAGKWRVSTDGGWYPVWSRNRRELLFEGADDRIMVSEYTTEGGRFNPGKPRQWSSKDIVGAGLALATFDAHPDGKRLMVLVEPAAEEPRGNLHATFVLNFSDELRRRVSIGR